MKVDNSLSREFLLSYPTEAARILEQVSTEHVVALLSELPPKTSTAMMVAMLPERAAACLVTMPVSLAAKLVTELPSAAIARIFRLLNKVKQRELLVQMPDKTRAQLRRYIDYPSESVGTLLNPIVDMLPESITVAEAIRRIEREGHAVNSDIYIIDDFHHLVGVVALGKLIASSRHTKLRDIMDTKTLSISVHATAESLLTFHGWITHRRLPVVERDRTLVGTLDYTHLQESLGQMPAMNSRDPLQNLLSLIELYWVSLAQLLDNVFSRTGRSKGE